MYLGCKILQEPPFNQDKYGVFLAKETGAKFDSLLVRYIEEGFIEQTVRKEFVDEEAKEEKLKPSTKKPRKVGKKATMKKPNVQVVMNPRARDKQRQKSVPTVNEHQPPVSREDLYNVKPVLRNNRHTKGVSHSQNLKRPLPK